MKEIENKIKLNGLPWWQAAAAVLLCGGTLYWGIQAETLTGILASCFALAVVFNEIGERIPVWNRYLGGGLLLCFFGVSVMKHFGMIPEATVTQLNGMMTEGDNVLELFIVVMIVGSVLALDRKVLIRSFAGYLPAILGGLVFACILGILGGLMFGVSPADAVIFYVLPIMGGGNGGGAVPLSEIYEQVTGVPASHYYAFAVIILTIANIFTIIASSLLNTLGHWKPSLTGDKKNLLRSGAVLVREEKSITPSLQDMSGAILIALAAYSAGRIMSEKILPTIAGAAIHQYAYMILFVVILAATGIVPASVRAGAKRLQTFFSTNLSVIIMVGLGAEFDIAELFTELTPGNVIMALLIVLGAVIGAGLVGYFVGFYPIDSALTAGLCMANRGGNGDLACLGAADRMELLAYAQLSSRLGGGIVLIIASFVFRFLL